MADALASLPPLTTKVTQQKNLAVHWILSWCREKFHNYVFKKNENKLFVCVVALKINE